MECNKNETFSAFGTNRFHSEFGFINEASAGCNQLYPVNKLPEKYRFIFSNYKYFNKLQSKAFDTILLTDKSIIVSSPTGSGKTVLFELAIIHFLETFEKCSNNLGNSKIIYVAPIKALCSERCEDWVNKFSTLGLKCIEITDDRELSDDIYLINTHQLIITTPEKWDSLTRKCKEFKYQLFMIKLFLIDEVHMINEDPRGATLETIVSRMKIISKITKLNSFKIRFVAVSATISNIEDIAKWLSCDQNYQAHYLKSNEDERPVKLQKIVLGYYHKCSGFNFDVNLTYKLKPLILQYSNGKPTLIFCSTKKSVEYTCNILVKILTFSICEDKQRKINAFLKEIHNKQVKELVKLGIGCHHAGMSFHDRNAVENLFRISCLSILVATSTLAMRINIPAHLVIIKSTEYYTLNGYKEYDECQILQMIGRAGRPQFDTSATVIIMTKQFMKDRYEQLLIGSQFVESYLHKYLIEHLNVEIFLGTIHNVSAALDWIRSTFFYVRAIKSPQNYGMIRTNDVNETENQLKNLCLTEIQTLACSGLINFINVNNIISSKPEGEIMAKYSISFATMKSYMQLKGTENLNDMIRCLTYSKEFEHIKFKKNEQKNLNILNKNNSPADAEVIRFPIEEGINTRESKINCLLQATLGTLKIKDGSLIQDANKIILISIQLTKALREISFRGTKFEIARSSCILAKCVSTRLWEQSKFVSKLIPKVGPVLSNDFVLNGKTTLKSIMETDPRDLERFLNRQPPFGNHVIDFIRQIPKYKVLVSFDEYLEQIILQITLMEYKNISNSVRSHTVSILIGDSENRLLKAQLICNKEFLEQGGVITMNISLKMYLFSQVLDYTITVCLISNQWVGNDIEIKFKPRNREEHVQELTSGENCKQESPMETFTYLRPIKQIAKKTKQLQKDKSQINIQKYLHNVSPKVQDSKVINKLLVEENYDTKQCDSIFPTRKITNSMIETQTTNQNNGHVDKYLKFGKHDLINYLCYDELLNDDVFCNLFIPDNNNLNVISKAFDSAIEKYCFTESVHQKEDLKNEIRLKVIEPMQLQENLSSFEKFENNLSISNDVHGTKKFTSLKESSNQIVCENINRLIKDESENKENKNVFTSEQIQIRVPFSVLKEKILNKNFQKPFKLLTNKSCVKKNHFIEFNRPKNISANFEVISSRTPFIQRNSLNNVVRCKSETTVRSKTSFLGKNHQKYTPPIEATGYLSRRIAENLKSSTDFYVHQKNLFGEEKTVPMTMDCSVLQTKSNDTYSIASICRITPRSHNSKAWLDKYFKASKSSRRLLQNVQNANKLIAVAAESKPTKNVFSVEGDKRLLNDLLKDTEGDLFDRESDHRSKQ